MRDYFLNVQHSPNRFYLRREVAAVKNDIVVDRVSNQSRMHWFKNPVVSIQDWAFFAFEHGIGCIPYRENLFASRFNMSPRMIVSLNSLSVGYTMHLRRTFSNRQAFGSMKHRIDLNGARWNGGRSNWKLAQMLVYNWVTLAPRNSPSAYRQSYQQCSL